MAFPWDQFQKVVSCEAGLHQSLFERLIFLGIRPVRLEAPKEFRAPNKSTDIYILTI